KRFGVVDRRGFAIEPVAGGKRRLETRHALFSLQRLQQRGFLSTDVGSPAVMRVQFKTEFRSEDPVAQKTCVARFLERLLEALVRVPDFPVYVVVAHADTHRIRCYDHAFDDDMRVVTQDVAILERAGLAFVGVADEIFLPGKRTGHEAPFQSGWKTGATATAQRRLFHLRDDLLWRDFLAENLAQCLIAAARFVVLEPPVESGEAFENDRVGPVDVWSKRRHRCIHLRNSSSQASSLSGAMKDTIALSLCRHT